MRFRLLSLALSGLLLPGLVLASGSGERPPPADPAAQEPPAAEEGGAQARAGVDAAARDQQAASRVPLEEISRFVTVFNAVREAYVDPVDDRELMQSAVRGLLLELDPHSAYLSGDAAEAFDESTTGAYGGIGVEVLHQADGSLRVVAPIDGTPAARAGLQPGDLITAVDGEPLTPESHAGAGPLRGEPGVSLVLTVLRQGEEAPLEISVTRERIHIVSVRGNLLEPGYGYIRVSAFQVDTASAFQEQLQSLQAGAGGPLRGLVLDLRSNPGGLLNSAVQIADDLLDSGAIVSTRGRISISDAEFNATPGDLLEGAPVVVIIDAGSASASEVLAGALSDNGRARIVGSRSFGKGSVQTVMPLDNGDSVKLTTARYYTPSGRSIQARGIQPDLVLEPGNGQPAAAAYSEAALPGHLHGEDVEDAEDGSPGEGAGAVLPGEGPVQAALAELKRMVAGAPLPAPPQGRPAAKPAHATAPDAEGGGVAVPGSGPGPATEREPVP